MRIGRNPATATASTSAAPWRPVLRGVGPARRSELAADHCVTVGVLKQEVRRDVGDLVERWRAHIHSGYYEAKVLLYEPLPHSRNLAT